MNKKALFLGIAYSLCYIIFKLAVLLGDYTLSNFGYYYSTVIGAVIIIPFLFIAIYLVRKDYGGLIAGKEALRIGLTVLAVGMIVTSVYNYVEFNWKLKDISMAYFNGPEYLDNLQKEQIKNPDKLKVEHFPVIIKEKIEGLSAFKAATGKLVPLLFFGLGGAFFASIFLKRSTR